MSFKFINNLIDLNLLVLIRLIFSIYPRMIEWNTQSLSNTEHAIAIQKAIDEVQKCTAS